MRCRSLPTRDSRSSGSGLSSRSAWPVKGWVKPSLALVGTRDGPDGQPVPNITPDRATGIGGWTEAQFVNAVKRGTGKNGEHLYPAFPYSSYSLLKTSDVRDLFAYLKTLPAVATPTGEGVTTPMTFTRSRRCVMVENLNLF